MSHPRRRPPQAPSRPPAGRGAAPSPAAAAARIRPFIWTVGIGIIAVAGAYGGASFKHAQDQQQAVKKFQRDPIEERIMQLEQIRANLSSTKARLEQDLAKAKARAAARAEKRASGG